MFNKEEEKTVISMDMGGAIEPVELPKEEENQVIDLPETKVVELPKLMQVGDESTEVPPIVENPTEAKPVEGEKKEEVKKPIPIPTIGPIPTTPPKPVEEKKEEVKEETREEEKPKAVPTPTTQNLEAVKEAAKAEALAAAKPKVAPPPIIGPLPKPPVKPPEIKAEAPKVEVPTTPVPQAVPVVPIPTVEPPKEEISAPIIPEETKEEVKEDVKEEVLEKEEDKGPEIIKGPNVIEAPIATENKEKEKKKNPYFLECPPNCIPIKPLGYIGYELLYAIPIIGLIFMLAHSASIKNYNRRNFARSHLIMLLLIILVVVGIIYLFNIDVIGFIENLTGYKIDIQHFKFTKFK